MENEKVRRGAVAYFFGCSKTEALQTRGKLDACVQKRSWGANLGFLTHEFSSNQAVIFEMA